MSHKVHPFVYRLGIITDWKSKWFQKNKYSSFLEQDVTLRDFIMKKLSKASVDKVVVERSPRVISLIIFTSRPGIIIGKGGTGIEDLKKAVEKRLLKFYKAEKDKKNIPSIRLEVQEVKNPDVHAQIIAQNVAEQLEKRMPFKRILKQNVEKVMQNRAAEGIKIAISGRLGGAEMSRREWFAQGKIPLQTLRADIDFAYGKAYLSYGIIGIKVWIYRGEVFSQKNNKVNNK